MSGLAPGGAPASNVEIAATPVEPGDILQLDGRACRASDLFPLSQRVVQLLVESGELLTEHTRTRLVAVRMLRRR